MTKELPTLQNILRYSIRYAQGEDKLTIMRALRAVNLRGLYRRDRDETRKFYEDIIDNDAHDIYELSSYGSVNIFVAKDLYVKIVSTRHASAEALEDEYNSYRAEYPHINKFRVLISTNRWGRRGKTVVGFTQLRKHILVPCFQCVKLKEVKWEVNEKSWDYTRTGQYRLHTFGPAYYPNAMVCRFIDTVSNKEFPNLNEHDRLVYPSL